MCPSMLVSHVTDECLQGVALMICSCFYEKPSRSSVVLNLTPCTDLSAKKKIPVPASELYPNYVD